MVRRIRGHETRLGNQSKGLSLASLCVFLTIAISTIWTQLRGQDSPKESRPSRPVQAAAENDDQIGRIPVEPMEVWDKLGFFRYPLGLCSIIVVWFTIERLVVLRYGRVIPRHFVKRFFEHLQEGNLDPKSALKLCEENGSPIALILANGVRKWGKSSVEVEQAIIDGGERQVSQLRKHIRVLNGAATVSPLLGLLGTVVGMIKSFNDIGQMGAMGKSEKLAIGIGLSLLTTAAGLAVAIPALVMYMYFTSRVDALVIEMDGRAQELVDFISAEALTEQSRAAKAGAVKPEARRAV